MHARDHRAGRHQRWPCAFIDTVQSPQAVLFWAPIGKRVPLHVTATGRALLSQLPDADRAVLLRKAVFERYTPTALMRTEAVEAEIDISLERGWFEGAPEFSADLGGVALPLRLEQRQLAVLVGGPMFRVMPIYAALARTMREEMAGLWG